MSTNDSNFNLNPNTNLNSISNYDTISGADRIKQINRQETDAINKLFVSNDIDGAVDKINLLNSQRDTVFNTITRRYENAMEKQKLEKKTGVEYDALLNMVQDNATTSKKKQQQIMNDKQKKERMVEINTYYSQRYQAQINLLKFVIKVFAVLLLLGYVRKIGFIPNNIMNALLLIVSVIGGYLVIMKYYDISTRNNMYFDEYDFIFNSGHGHGGESIWEYNKKHLFDPIKDDLDDTVSNVVNITSCVGDNCCGNNTRWDSASNKCVLTASDLKTGDSGTEGSIKTGAVVKTTETVNVDSS